MRKQSHSKMQPSRLASLEVGFKIGELAFRNKSGELEEEIASFFTQAGFNWHKGTNPWSNLRAISNTLQSLPNDLLYVWNWVWVGIETALLPNKQEEDSPFIIGGFSRYLDAVLSSESEVREILALSNRVGPSKYDDWENCLGQIKDRLRQNAKLEDESN